MKRTSTSHRPPFGEGSFAVVTFVLTTALLIGLGWALMSSGVAAAAPEQSCSLRTTTVLSEQMVSGINSGLASYQKIGREQGVYWGVLVGIHSRESSLSHSNPPDSEHGIMGLVTVAAQRPGLFPRGEALDSEGFEDQLRQAAKFLKLKADQRPAGSVNLTYSSGLADYGRALHEYYGHLTEFDQVRGKLGKDESWKVNPYVVNNLEGYAQNLTLFQVGLPDVSPDLRPGALTIAAELNKLCDSGQFLATGGQSLFPSLEGVGQMADALSSLPVNGWGALGVMVCLALLVLANIKRLMAWPLGALVVAVVSSVIGTLWHYLDVLVANKPDTLGLIGIRTGAAMLLLLLAVFFIGQGAKEIASSNNVPKVLWRRGYIAATVGVERTFSNTSKRVKRAPTREKAMLSFFLGLIKASLVIAILMVVILSGAIAAGMWLALVTVLESLHWLVRGGYRQLTALVMMILSYLISSRWAFGSMPFLLWLMAPLAMLCLMLVMKAQNGSRRHPSQRRVGLSPS